MCWKMCTPMKNNCCKLNSRTAYFCTLFFFFRSTNCSAGVCAGTHKRETKCVCGQEKGSYKGTCNWEEHLCGMPQASQGNVLWQCCSTGEVSCSALILVTTCRECLLHMVDLISCIGWNFYCNWMNTSLMRDGIRRMKHMCSLKLQCNSGSHFSYSWPNS